MTQSTPTPGREAAGQSGAAATDATQANAAAPAANDPVAADGEAPGEDAVEVVVEGPEGPEAAPVAEELLLKAQAEVKDWQDKYMRLHAEWDTYRRRTAEQREAEKARATEKLVTSLLPVLDDFERTIAYAEQHGEAGLLDGVKAVSTKLGHTLEKDGLITIDPIGEPFDALEAQAVATVEDAEAFDETVREVYQKGYKMGSKVLRPAMVTVTTGGPKRPKTPDEGDDQ